MIWRLATVTRSVLRDQIREVLLDGILEGACELFARWIPKDDDG